MGPSISRAAPPAGSKTGVLPARGGAGPLAGRLPRISNHRSRNPGPAPVHARDVARLPPEPVSGREASTPDRRKTSTVETSLSQMQALELVLPRQALVLLGLAGVLLLVAMAVQLLSRRRKSRFHSAMKARLRRQRRHRPEERRPQPARPPQAGDSVPVLRCLAEFVERRPLSEAQWDSPVPAAWTVFRLRLHDDDATRPRPDFQLGLLLPVQHPQAYSAGYLERLEATGVEALLQAFSQVLSGPVPGPAITGSQGGFLEFKTYVENPRPDAIASGEDVKDADYWIFVKMYVQDTMEMQLRLNVRRGEAEFSSPTAENGEELMRVLAATLRPVD